MTVPSLMQNHQRKTYVTQLHKVYTEVQQASIQYMTDRNAVNLREAGLTSAAKIKEFTLNYFKVINDCGTGIQAPCFSESYKNLNGVSSNTKQNWSGASVVTLASGAAIAIDKPNIYSKTVDGITSYYGHMLIDINGPQGPNIGGRDMFYVEFYDDGSIDIEGATPSCKSEGICGGSSLKDIRDTYYNSHCKASTFGAGCFGKILNDNWEMTY